MVVFIKKTLKSRFDVRLLQNDILRLGKYNLANKGSIHANISINYERLEFYNCHLASGIKEKNCFMLSG